jgi:hypothetical protein
MKKCTKCGVENRNARIFCESCNSYLPRSDQAIALEKNLQSPTPVKKKTRKSPEYVRLHHGPIVKKSTAKWIEKKQENASIILLGIIAIMLAIAICSNQP